MSVPTENIAVSFSLVTPVTARNLIEVLLFKTA